VKKRVAGSERNAPHPLERDLAHVFEKTQHVWPDLRKKRLFLTGGTGFFGSWLLESFAWLNTLLNTEAEIVVLSRNPGAFSRKAPHLAANKAIKLVEGDIRDFKWPEGPVDYVIHGAAQASAQLNQEEPLVMFDTIVAGTRRVLEFAREKKARRLLFISSGAVYGKQPSDITHIPEEYRGAPDVSPASAYGEGKRVGELLCSIYRHQFNLETVIARCFAFVGPHLDLNIHFAIGNFIRDGLRGGPIQVTGDGTPYRSYLYAADLAVWLWVLLLKAKDGAIYNVGSEEAVTIADLARTVATCFEPPRDVNIALKADPARPSEQYVPSTGKARRDLGLTRFIDLKDAVRRTIDWHGMARNGTRPAI